MRRNRDALLQDVTNAAAEQARLADEPGPAALTEAIPEPETEPSTAMSPDLTSPAPTTGPALPSEDEPLPTSPAPVAAAGPSAAPPQAVAELLQQPRRQSLEVHGFRVQLTEEQARRGQICTTVYMPIELREAIREAEQLTGRNYQELMRIAIGQLLDQLSQAS